MAPAKGPVRAAGPGAETSPELRTGQVVRLALIIGLLIGGGVLGFIGLTRSGDGAPAARSGEAFNVVVPAVGVGAVVTTLVLAAAIRRTAAAAWESRADDDAAQAAVRKSYQGVSLAQGAAIELPGLLGAAATFVTGNGLFLVATGLSVLALAALFPRAATLDRWIEEVTGAARESESEPSENA